jgi:hypothetical protein
MLVAAMLQKPKATIANLASAITSVICMGQMGATLGSAAGTMMAMGSSGSAPVITLLLQAIGLGFLTQISDEILRPFLLIILAVTAALSYLSYKRHKDPKPFGLTLFGSVLTYSSIYIVPSEIFYYASFLILLGATVWHYKLEKTA